MSNLDNSSSIYIDLVNSNNHQHQQKQKHENETKEININNLIQKDQLQKEEEEEENFQLQQEIDYNNIKNILESNDSSDTALPTPTPLPSDEIDFELPSSSIILHSPITKSTIILVGSIHIHKGSSDDVSNVIRNWKPDTVFIELCQSRAGLILTPPHTRILRTSKKILNNRLKQHYSRTFLTESSDEKYRGWEDEDQYSSGSKIKLETELADIDIEDMTQEDNELFSTSGTEEDDEDDDEDDDYYGFEFDYDNSKFNSIRVKNSNNNNNISSNNNNVNNFNNMNIMNNIMNNLNDNSSTNSNEYSNSPKRNALYLYEEDKYNNFNILYNNLNNINNQFYNSINNNISNGNNNNNNNSFVNNSNNQSDNSNNEKDNSYNIPINEELFYSNPPKLDINNSSISLHQIIEQEELLREQQLQQEQEVEIKSNNNNSSFNYNNSSSNYSEADDERSNSPSPYFGTNTNTTPYTTNTPPTPMEDENDYTTNGGTDEPATFKDMINIVKVHGLSGLLHILMAELIRKAGKQSNVNPGSEFITAFVEAKKIGSLVVLGDRLIDVTLQRVWNSLSSWEKLKFVFYLFMASISEVTNDEIEKINSNSEEIVTELLNEFRDRFPSVVQTIVTERDQYMAARLRMCPGKKIVAVVGRGHIKGIVKEWTNNNINLAELENINPKSSNNNNDDSSWSVVTKLASLILIPMVGIASFFFFNKKYHII